MRKPLKYFIVAAACCASLYAQVTGNELDKKYTPNSNSIFNNLLRKNEATHGSSEVTIQNSLKFCPTMLLRQKVAFFYERELVDGFAINIGAGKAFGNDVFQNAYFELFPYTETEKVLTPVRILSFSEYYGSSIMISTGLKIYFSGRVFDDGFVEFSYRRERLDYLLEARINNLRVENGNIASFATNGFSFGFGFTNTSGIKNNFTHEFFMSFGLKNVQFTRYDEVTLQPAFSGASGEIVFRRSDDVLGTRILPAISMGYAFGFGF